MHIPKFKPMGDYVLIKKQEEITDENALIIKPDTAKGIDPVWGTVLGFSPGLVSKKGVRRPPDVRMGDKVLVGFYAGREIQLEGQEYLLCREEDLMLVHNG